METHEAMRELCTILGIGSIIQVSTEDIVARVRNLAAQSAEAHTRLDDAGVVKSLDLPVRVSFLRKEVRGALDGWAQANSRVDQANEELVAARGDLRVERERSEMLEKKLSGQQSNVDEAQRRAKAEIEDSKLAWEVLCSHGASNVRGLVPLHEAVKSVFGRLVKERDKANEELSETRQALGGFMGPDYRISEEVKKVVAIRDMLAARANEAEQKMMFAVSDLGTMTAERDTLAARVKEMEGRLEGARQYVNGLEAWGIKPLPRRAIPADVDMLDMLCNHAKAYIVFEKRDGSGTKVLLKDNNGLGWNGTKERSIDFPPPSTAVNPSKPGLQPMTCPCGGKIEFGSERVGYCQKCGASCRVMDPPPDTCDHDQSLTAALVEANRNTAKWRTRAQKCQQALRRIRSLTGDMSFALDEDWGND